MTAIIEARRGKDVWIEWEGERFPPNPDDILSPREIEFYDKVHALQAGIDKLQREQLIETLELLKRTRAELTERILRIPTDEEGEWTAMHLADLDRAVTWAMNDFGRQYGGLLDEATWRSFDTLADLHKGVYREAAPSLFARPVVLNRQQLELASRYNADLVRKLTDRAKQDLTGKLRGVVLGTATPFQAMQEIRPYLDIPERPKKGQNGVRGFGGLAYQAARVVVTESNRMASLAGQVVQSSLIHRVKYDDTVGGEWVRVWLHSGQAAGRPEHIEMHGQTVDEDHMFVLPTGHMTFGPHDGALPAEQVIFCRCTSLVWNLAWGPPPVALAPGSDAAQGKSPKHDERMKDLEARYGAEAVGQDGPGPELERQLSAEAKDTRERLLVATDAAEAHREAERKKYNSEAAQILLNDYRPLRSQVTALISQSQVARMDGDDARRREIDVQIAEINSRLIELDRQMEALKAQERAIDAERAAMIAAARALVLADPNATADGIDWTVKPAPGASAAFLAKVDEARLWLSRMLADMNLGATKSPRVHANTSTDRAHYSPNTSTIHVYEKTGDDANVVIHEFGHHLEHQMPNVRRAVFSWLDRRTEGDPERLLRGVTGKNYGDTEWTQPDDFINPYMGKVYREKFDFDTMQWKGKRTASEILAMGLELMRKDPAELARKDPDMFDMIYKLTRGAYGGRRSLAEIEARKRKRQRRGR